MSELTRHIATLRGFNRFYTRQIGLLRKGYLGTPFSLAEGRVLYEIAEGHHRAASDIARELDLDAGYLSRVLRNFERRGLIARSKSAKDQRRSHLSLTAQGRRMFAPLEKRSQSHAGAMLGALTPDQQARLVDAMTSIQAMLAGRQEPRGTPALRAPRAGDFGWIVTRHAQLYAQEYGWTDPFEGLCAQIVADFVNKFDATRERCWIAELNGENIGSIMLAKDSDNVARIRLLLVDPKARGLGLGSKLTDACIAFARGAGYRKITLWTHRNLIAARRIYAKAGFVLMRSEKHKSWGKPVVSEHWDLEL